MSKGSRGMTHAGGPVSTVSIRVLDNNVTNLMLEAMLRYG